MPLSDLGLTLAQAAPLPFDPSALLTQGPLGAAVVLLFWMWRQERDEKNKLIEAHKIEIAAERALNAKLQDERLDDQKVLIPLASAMTAATQQASGLIARMAEK